MAVIPAMGVIQVVIALAVTILGAPPVATALVVVTLAADAPVVVVPVAAVLAVVVPVAVVEAVEHKGSIAGNVPYEKWDPGVDLTTRPHSRIRNQLFTNKIGPQRSSPTH